MKLNLVSRRQRWGLTWRGWLVTLALSVTAALLFINHIYSFLAVTERAECQLLVVEGWVHDYAIHAAGAEFSGGCYRQVVATGGPVQGIGGYINDYSTAANIGAARLRHIGIPPDRVQAAPSRTSNRDRTYASAVALREWLKANHVFITSCNIITEDVHARRTRLLFEQALGSRVKVGVIAISNPDYDSAHWWRYSEGVRAVLGEAISYLYARLLFQPPARA